MREAILPAGTVDYNVQKVYNELPQWGESFSQARARYQQTIKELADKYPTENLLFLTHGEALQTALSSTRMVQVESEVKLHDSPTTTNPLPSSKLSDSSLAMEYGRERKVGDSEVNDIGGMI
ncbi:hypothetical protein P8452_27050 [Trifolium repens]|nr:hypothetical protein P8452_27050 [Trifolium repens]